MPTVSPALDAEARERVREPRDLAAELRVRQRADAAVLRLRDHRDLVAAPRGDVHVHALRGQVHAAVDEPARPLDAVRGVDHPRVRRAPLPAEIARDGRPVPLEVLHGAPLQVRERGEAVRLHEPRDARARRGLGIRAPDDLVHVHG